MKFLLVIILTSTQLFCSGSTLHVKDNPKKTHFGVAIGTESGRVIGHGPSMFALGITPPSIGFNAYLFYAEKSTRKKWGKEYSIGFSQRGFVVDGQSYKEDLSLDYINLTAGFYKPYAKKSSLHLDGYLSYLLTATYQLGKSPIYNVKSNYKPLDVGLSASYNYNITHRLGLRLTQNIGLLPLDQGNSITELNNSTVLSIIFDLL
jgi:hypothetical protein